MNALMSCNRYIIVIYLIEYPVVDKQLAHTYTHTHTHTHTHTSSHTISYTSYQFLGMSEYAGCCINPGSESVTRLVSK